MFPNMVSIVLPSRNEMFLNRTIDEIYDKASGEIQVIPVMDGEWADPMPEDRKSMVVVKLGKSQGMRRAINVGVSVAKGKYIMKLDAHCALDEGFDEKLKEKHEPDWVSIPRRYSLDPDEWTPRRRAIDYCYLSFPDNPGDWGGPGYHGRVWGDRNKNKELRNIPIDDQMSFQGSCWFMEKEYFRFLKLLDVPHYGPFWQEAQEIGPKCFYSGGRLVRNKTTWYAHLHKGKRFGRGYFLSSKSIDNCTEWTSQFIEGAVDLGDRFKKRNLKDWVEKFWPIPGWPEDWEEQLKKDKYERRD
jgi:glycosyltransferase involved in cell wall biosynthesis